MIIKVKSPNSDKFGDSISVILDILSKIQPLPPDEEIILDFSSCHFSNPFVLLSLTILHAEFCKIGRSLIINRESTTYNFESYLNYIHYHEGLKPDLMRMDDYTSRMKAYESKNYIPIINFPATRNSSETAIRDAFLSVINRHLHNQLSLTGQLYSAIMYLIDEAINNIVDHSLAARGFIFTQYYRMQGYMDITIADNGIGVLGSYKNNNYPDVLTDADALTKALEGISTKNSAIGRGFGIRTSRNMLVNGLGGKYFLFSGNAFLINTPEKGAIIKLDKTFRMSGTILFMRVPMQYSSEFQYVNYIES